MAVVHNPLIPTDVRIVVGQLLTILADLNERVSKLEGERHAERGSTR